MCIGVIGASLAPCPLVEGCGDLHHPPPPPSGIINRLWYWKKALTFLSLREYSQGVFFLRSASCHCLRHGSIQMLLPVGFTCVTLPEQDLLPSVASVLATDAFQPFQWQPETFSRFH
jgi:hypothetical protein